MESTEIEKEILAEKKSISRLRIFFILFLIAVVACFGVFYDTAKKHLGRQMDDATVFDTRVQNLDNSIASHERRIAALEDELQKLKAHGPTTAAAPATPATPDTALLERLETLEKTVKSHPASASEKQDNAQVSQAVSLLSLFYRLSSNITSGKPFIAELSSLQEKFSADNDKSLNDVITLIQPYADNGIPTTNKLIASFDDAVDSLKRNETTLPENAGAWEKFTYNLSRIVTIRKIDKNQKGNATSIILGRAEDHLDNEEIEAAITEVKSLPDNVRSSFTIWLEDAQIASQAPSLVDQMEEKVMKKAFTTPQPQQED